MAWPIILPVIGVAAAAAVGYRFFQLTRDQEKYSSYVPVPVIPNSPAGKRPEGNEIGPQAAYIPKITDKVKPTDETILNLPGHPRNGQKMPYYEYIKIMQEDEAKRHLAAETSGKTRYVTKYYPNYPEGILFEPGAVIPGKTYSKGDFGKGDVLFVDVGSSGINLPLGTSVVEFVEYDDPEGMRARVFSIDPRAESPNTFVIPSNSVNGIIVP